MLVDRRPEDNKKRDVWQCPKANPKGKDINM